ncbi:tyrosine-protein phosphatase [Candidatus Cloacimonadota bacterium]
MIDIHTHILPYCDDGAETMDASLIELSEISNSGVTDVILTPHYIRNIFKNSRNANVGTFLQLKQKLAEKDINVRIHQGTEIYLDDNIWQDIEKYQLNLAESHYILVETGFSGFPSNLLEIFYQLVKKGYKPILAHPERYGDIMNDIDLAEELIYRDIYLQMNAGSFLGYYGNKVQRTAWKMLKRKLVHFLASDTHCNLDYYFLKEALQTAAKHTDADFIDLITRRNPEKILQDLEINHLHN